MQRLSNPPLQSAPAGATQRLRVGLYVASVFAMLFVLGHALWQAIAEENRREGGAEAEVKTVARGKE